MSSVNKILLWIRKCYFISYTVMYSFVEFESLKKWLVLALLTCRFLTFANSVWGVRIHHQLILMGPRFFSARKIDLTIQISGT